MTEQRKQELLEIIEKMKQVSTTFYTGAIHCNNHAFIEFTGFINEYIKICEYNLAQEIDFTECDIHSGRLLQVEDFQKEYIQEKLNCIFSGSLTISDRS